MLYIRRRDRRRRYSSLDVKCLETSDTRLCASSVLIRSDNALRALEHVKVDVPRSFEICDVMRISSWSSCLITCFALR